MTVKIKFDRRGEVGKITGNVGRTRMNRGALELWKGNVEPTVGYKLRRFIRRALNELSVRAEAAYAYHTVGTPSAAEMPYIGLEECSRNE